MMGSVLELVAWCLNTVIGLDCNFYLHHLSQCGGTQNGLGSFVPTVHFIACFWDVQLPPKNNKQTKNKTFATWSLYLKGSGVLGWCAFKVRSTVLCSFCCCQSYSCECVCARVFMVGNG